jgi:hypothetical protein
MTTDEAYDVVETVRDAYCRTMLFSAGAPPPNFHGDNEEDPIFDAALRRFVADFQGGSSSQRSSTPERRKPWWKFW